MKYSELGFWLKKSAEWVDAYYKRLKNKPVRPNLLVGTKDIGTDEYLYQIAEKKINEMKLFLETSIKYSVIIISIVFLLLGQFRGLIYF